MEEIKVLLIVNYKAGTGGISGQVEKIQRHLLKEGVQTAICSSGTAFFEKIMSPIRILFQAKRYNVFHIHTCSFLGFYSAIIGISIGRLLKKKIILTYHGGDCDEFFRKYPRIVRFFLLKTDTNIVLSGFIGTIFDKYNLPYIIIPNIIDLDEKLFKKRNEITPNFISIRTLRPLYNITCIIKAFQSVQYSIPEATLLIVGDGSQRRELEDYVIENKIPNITFVGRVDNSQIFDYLNKADILLSSPIIDNMPVSLLEAMNAGLLVISSNVGGVPYMIQNGFNGILFKSDDSVELASKILNAINNPIGSLSMIQNAKNGLYQYSWDAIWPKLRKHYLLH